MLELVVVVAAAAVRQCPIVAETKLKLVASQSNSNSSLSSAPIASSGRCWLAVHTQPPKLFEPVVPVPTVQLQHSIVAMLRQRRSHAQKTHGSQCSSHTSCVVVVVAAASVLRRFDVAIVVVVPRRIDARSRVAQRIPSDCEAIVDCSCTRLVVAIRAT